MRIKIIPTKILSYYAFALTPASPTMPIVKPAAYILKLPLMKIHSKVQLPYVYILMLQNNLYYQLYIYIV
jgi:hypothetical protein